MTEADTDLLAELVDQKRACLLRLRELGREQLELIDQGNLGQLLVVLGGKQRLLGEIEQIERSLDPFRSQEPNQRRWRSEAQRQRCALDLESCEALLQEIFVQEKEGESQLARRRDEAAARLEDVGMASRARGAYVARPEQSWGGLDLASGG